MCSHEGYLLISNLWDRLFFSSLGLILALYSYYVEIRKEMEPGYQAACDLGDRMCCSRVLTSRYGRGFGIVSTGSILNVRNCVLGMFFYLFNITLGFSTHPVVMAFLFYNAILSTVVCFYLAYVLICVLGDLCVVCMATYVCNGALLYLYSYRNC